VSRVVVIGAGLGGLATAARLARLRHEVVVVEAAEAVGGQTGGLTRGSFGWDTGPTSVTLPAALRDLFLKTGKPLETVLDLEPLEPLARLRFADGTDLDLPNTGVRDVAAAFDAALGGRSGDDWRRFHEHASEVWALARGSLVEGPLPRPRDLLFRSPRLHRVLTTRRTLRDDARRFFADERQQMWLEHQATGFGSDPRRAPAWLSVWPYVEHTFRGWTVRGGMRSLVDAVHDRAVSRGAVVQTGARVVAVSTSGRVDGVRLEDGRVLPADIVVSDVDARQLYDDLLPHDASRRTSVEPRPSASVFTLLLGLRGLTPDVRPRTVLFSGDPDRELDAVFGVDARGPEDPTLSVHVSRDPAHAPADSEAWTVQVTVPRHGAGPGALDWSAERVAAGYAEHLLDRLAARELDLRDRVVVAEHRSPADVERSTGSPGGAAYGAAMDGARAAWLRAANRSPVPGLFLVGASAHPGGGIPSVTMSAAIVAEMIGRA
jgi:phytoene desaturase